MSMGGNGGSGKSTADRIKLSATARDIPSEPPRKSLESFADESRFFGTFASFARALTHALSRQRLSTVTSTHSFDFDYRYWCGTLLIYLRRRAEGTVAYDIQFYSETTGFQ